MSILDWFDVGMVSAERDDNLSKYFFDNGVTKRVVDNASAFLVLGRKGAGKTAVFRYLSENQAQFLDEKDLLVPLSFEDYNWNVHALLAKREAADSLTYKQSWRFVILVEALKAYVGALEREGAQIPKRLGAAMKLLNKLFDTPLPSIYQIIGRKMLGLSKLTLPKFGVDPVEGGLDSLEVSGGEVGFEDVKASDDLQAALSRNVDHLISYLEDALESADIKERRIFVCFDRVDEAWDEVSLETSKRVIAGLVSAADAVSSRYGRFLRPIVFLREDIFETLSLNDTNKLREDCGALLHWTRDTMFKLLLARVNFYADQAGIDPVDDLFDKREMRQRAKPSSYLLKRSMMRPRDVICFIRRIVDSMRNHAEDPFAEQPQVSFDKLAVESIYEAESGYSEWLKKELLDEWGVQYPEIRQLLAVFQNHGSTNIDSDTLVEGVKSIDGSDDRARVMSHLRFLFDNSVIGFKVGDSTAWRFKCFYPSQGFDVATEYHVHDGLIRALNLKEPRDTSRQM